MTEPVAPEIRSPRPFRLLSILGVIIFLILAIAAYLYLEKIRNAGNGDYAISLGSGPLHQLYTVTDQGATLSPIMVRDASDTEFAALDAATGADGSVYYLLVQKGQAMPASNLYVKDSHGTLTQLTNSPTFKQNLSFDAKSRTFVYQSGPARPVAGLITAKDWNITRYSLEDKKEGVIGNGVAPHLLAGGHSVFFERNGSLYALNADTRSAVPLLTMRWLNSYAYDPASNMVAVINVRTNAIDYYKVAEEGSLSYKNSVPAAFLPLGITYVKGTLVGWQANPVNAQNAYSIANISGGGAISLQVSAAAYGSILGIYDYHE